MAGLETRISRLEAAEAERGPDGVWSLPFWSGVASAMETENFSTLLGSWELPRRIAFGLRQAAEPCATDALRAHASEWTALLFDGNPPDLRPVEMLTAIRTRLREIFGVQDPSNRHGTDTNSVAVNIYNNINSLAL